MTIQGINHYFRIDLSCRRLLVQWYMNRLAIEETLKRPHFPGEHYTRPGTDHKSRRPKIDHYTNDLYETNSLLNNWKRLLFPETWKRNQ